MNQFLNIIEAGVYTKPTGKHQFLSYTSCHSRGGKQDIPNAQALRFRRICSTKNAFERRANELAKYLVAYRERFVREQIRKA